MGPLVDHYQNADFQTSPPYPESWVPGAVDEMLCTWSMLGVRERSHPEKVVNKFMQGVEVEAFKEAFSVENGGRCPTDLGLC